MKEKARRATFDRKMIEKVVIQAYARAQRWRVREIRKIESMRNKRMVVE